MHPTRPLTFMVAAAILALAAAGALGARRETGHGPIYSVAALRAQLDRAPLAWAGRIAWVRARAEACLDPMDGPGSPCRERQPVLVGAGPGQHAVALPLVPGRASPLLIALRRLPLVGRLVPGPHAIRWDVVATYRVRLCTAPAASCAAPPCYQALLLDTGL